MIDIFMKSPSANTLAVIVLVLLIFTWITSIVAATRETPISTDSGWYSRLLPIFSIAGIPAAWDLLQTEGITFLFAIIVCIVLLLNFVIPILNNSKRSPHSFVTDWYTWSILITSLGGLIVAGYLSFMEATDSQVICGPSHGCDTVQNSKYAILFGVLPVGILGFAGYIGILLGWLAYKFGPATIKKMAAIAIWAMCIFGVFFEIYLTFLEPFVIGATCMWCISSAVFMIILLLVSTPAAQQALAIEDD